VDEPDEYFDDAEFIDGSPSHDLMVIGSCGPLAYNVHS
jgi:hypothetical protein